MIVLRNGYKDSTGGNGEALSFSFFGRAIEKIHIGQRNGVRNRLSDLHTHFPIEVIEKYKSRKDTQAKNFADF